MKNLTVEEFESGINTDEKAVILDVRTPEEEVEGIIEGSININIMSPDFTKKVLELDKENIYYVFCRAGGRSAKACEFLESNGYKAYNLLGGIQAWNVNH